MKFFSFRLMSLGLALTAVGFHPAKADNIDRISVGFGAYDVTQNDDSAGDFRIEYRPGTPIVWELRPWLGAEVTSDGAVYGVAGFLYDFHLTNQWLLTPSVGAGLYAEGSGKDLGSTIEFRSQIELGYQFDNASRVSAAFGHISNASIGDDNPGTEILSVYYHMPISWIRNGPGAQY